MKLLFQVLRRVLVKRDRKGGALLRAPAHHPVLIDVEESTSGAATVRSLSLFQQPGAVVRALAEAPAQGLANLHEDLGLVGTEFDLTRVVVDEAHPWLESVIPREIDHFLGFGGGGTTDDGVEGDAKFGQPSQQGRGQGEGTGEGQTGSSGFATADGTPMSVMGNEHRPGRGNTPSRQNSRFGKGVGPLTANVSRSESDKAEAMKGLNPVNRQSGAVSSETALEEYSDLVDTYFKAITTRKTP